MLIKLLLNGIVDISKLIGPLNRVEPNFIGGSYDLPSFDTTSAIHMVNPDCGGRDRLAFASDVYRTPPKALMCYRAIHGA